MTKMGFNNPIFSLIKLKNKYNMNIIKRIKKRFEISFIRILLRKKRKKFIPEKDSIRPMKTRTIYPPNWVEPKVRKNSDGTETPYGFKR